jgi:CRISPR-associated endonuclease/helicase Cas3
MNILVCSESHGDSARRAAAALDMFLPRVGRRTWSGAISAEGLDDLRKALRSRATRATAVAGHRLVNGRRARLEFLIGNRDAFGPGGEVPVSWTRRRRRPTDRTLVGELAFAAVGLGSSFHDLGKLSQGFQDFLLASVFGTTPGKKLHQPFRHELVSVAILCRAVEICGAGSDIAFLEAISDPDRAAGLFLQALRSYRSMRGWAWSVKAAVGDGLDMSGLLPDRVAFPFLRAVADLVLSHHRLPFGEVRLPAAAPLGQSRATAARAEVSVRDVAHVSRGGLPLMPAEKFLTPATAAERSLVEAPCRWQAGVARDARRALAVLREAPAFSASDWAGASVHYCRLAMMLGDHQASGTSVARPVDDPVSAVASVCFANTRTVGNRKQSGAWDDFEDAAEVEMPGAAAPGPDTGDQAAGRHLADTWSAHTHKVRRHAIAALGHLLRKGGWPGIQRDDLPSRLLACEAPDGQFAWQDRAAATISAGLGKSRAALVYLLASTGTGKTVAVPKISAAIAGENPLRLNLCQGMRSLTLQTGDEYLAKRIGFTKRQALVVIGSTTARLLHDLGRSDNTSSKTANAEPASVDGDLWAIGGGTDAAVESADDIVDGGDPDGELNPLAERAARMDKHPGKRLRLLATPILISTIDTLMSVADARRGGHLGDALRLASADLVIDEIDSYDTEDLVAILRLVRAAAAYGRSVTVSTATLRHGHASAIRRAYAAGRREHAAMTGATAEFTLAWASEHVVEVAADDARDGQEASATFSARHRAVATRMASALSTVPPRRRYVVVPVKGGHDAAAFGAGLDLHARNHVIDPKSGIRISVGFVRWNRVASTRRFARFVAGAQAPEGHAIAFACYHSKFSLAVRNGVYGRISSMLSREPGPDGTDPLLEDVDIVRHIRQASAEGHTDLVCFVSVTNILEAGCDLDGDWGVSEPCSERSLLQFAGRIRRHRFGKWDWPNVAVLDTAFPTGGQRLEGPGVETPIGSGFGRPSFYAPLASARTATSMFPNADWKERVDASSCLLDRPSASGDAEVAMLEGACGGDAEALRRLKSADPAKPSNREMLMRLESLSSSFVVDSPWALWTDLHARERRFRRSTGPQREFRPTSVGWMAKLNEKGATWVASDHLVAVETRLSGNSSATSRLLLEAATYDTEAAAREIEDSLSTASVPPSRWVSEEIRTASMTIRRDRSQEPVWFEPWLGFDNKPSGASQE